MLISEEDILKKLENSGLSPKEILQLYWSIIYCVIPSVTGHALADDEREKQEKLQRALFKKINKDVLSDRVKTILRNLEETEAETRRQCRAMKHPQHVEADKAWDNNIGYLKKLIRFNFTANSPEIAILAKKLDDYLKNPEAAPKNKLSEKSTFPAPKSPEKEKESVQTWKLKKTLTIAGMIAAGVGGGWIIYNLVKKKDTK